MFKPLLILILGFLILSGYSAEAIELSLVRPPVSIACKTAPNGASRGHRELNTEGKGFGFCVVTECGGEFESVPYKGKCVKARSFKWISKPQTLMRSGIEISLRAAVSRSFDSDTEIEIDTSLSSATNAEYSLKSPKALFKAGQKTSQPIQVRIEKISSSELTHATFRLSDSQPIRLDLLPADQTSKVTANIRFVGVANLSNGSIELSVELSRIVSTHFSTKLTVKVGETTHGFVIERNKKEKRISIPVIQAGTLTAEFVAVPGSVVAGAPASIEVTNDYDPLEVTCGEISRVKRNVKFCYQDRAAKLSSASSTIPVIYYFHGITGSEREIFDGFAAPLLNDIATQFGGDSPPVINLSIGSIGVINDDSGAINSALTEIESTIAPGKTIERILIGASMGGHNALRFAGEFPSRVKAIAALCPAISKMNGQNNNEVFAYTIRNAGVLDQAFFTVALLAFRAEYTTEELWSLNNPFRFLQFGSFDNLPLFLSVGNQDQLGFLEGARAFRTDLLVRGPAPLTYSEVNGSHCSFNGNGLINFLQQHL